ncbi:MAG TPA: four helix bundle protein [Candidatus Binatia bacterium]|nr:four helix bundle protein [Candidatus Binatia bacterium]
MSELRHAESLRDLLVYQRTKAVSRVIFELSKSFPKEEMFSLTDQVRRAVRSIGAQIAEAWAKRRYEKHFISKLSDADAEQMETQHWLSEACSCGYIESPQAEALLAELEQIGRMLNSMMEKSHLFCNQKPNIIRDQEADYLVEEDH